MRLSILATTGAMDEATAQNFNQEIKIMSKTLEQLQNYLEHYLANYSLANRMGKAIIRSHLNKLKSQIYPLKLNNDEFSAFQVIVNKELAHLT